MSKDNELMLDVGQANELKLAFRRNGWTNADAKKLCDGDTLAKILHIVRDNNMAKVGQHLIDLDAKPFVPDRWKLAEHKKGGKIVWSREKVKLYLSPEQEEEGTGLIGGMKLHKKLKKKCVMNANLLAFFYKNQKLIPKEWKGMHIFFWGTIYYNQHDNLCVRYLYFHEGAERWDSSSYVLDPDTWDYNCPAVVAA